MSELFKCCRVCLQLKSSNVSLYQHHQYKYLPSVIESICGVVISFADEPHALICSECAEEVINADSIIQKCQESDKILFQQRNNNAIVKLELEEVGDWLETADCEQEVDGNSQNYFLESKMLAKPILENSMHDEAIKQQTMTNSDKVIAINSKRKKTRKQKLRFKRKHQLQNEKQERSDENAALLYQSHIKTSKPKKTLIRSREQYLNRKIKNYTVKEPLKLIGGAEIVRKRKHKSHHRVIPNFYFHCELCHQFESNIATYAVSHLNTVHAIEKPAIFRCSQCDAKPFIKNQSLQDHIATIHEQQPKKRDFICHECGKTFIKNSHLQKHLQSVHKIEEIPFKSKISKCDEEFVGSNLNLDHDRDEENSESLATFHQCDACGKSYRNVTDLNKHLERVHAVGGFRCFQCGCNFREKARYDAHVKRTKCKPAGFLCR